MMDALINDRVSFVKLLLENGVDFRLTSFFIFIFWRGVSIFFTFFWGVGEILIDPFHPTGSFLAPELII